MAQTALHRNQTGRQVHTPFASVYANATARLADTDWTTEDVNKIVLEELTGGVFRLTGVSPIVWEQVATSTSVGDVVGPALAADGNVVVYDGTSGELVQDTGVVAANLLTEGGFAEDLTVDTSTSTTFASKVSLSVNVTAGDTYYVWVSYQHNSNGSNSDFLARIQYNGADAPGVIWGQRKEPKDVSNSETDEFFSSGTNQRELASNMRRLVPSTTGSLTITLDWASSLTGVEATIWGASILVMRKG